ncbi:MAG: 16S rRNA (guanine(527)-N(7))-methyltransferase RsmG [Clostridia bacterium]|nr:16S rRNA (guanine(527)-N(7))-methyltransferase RsmG [Clostridia bacterium]
MSIFTNKLISVANKNQATKNLINEENAIRLEALTSHMLEVNKTLNLTAIKDEDGVILKHLVDSSAVIPFIPENATLCDIGCGGGFPSLVIAVLRPDVSVFSVDSVSKKVAYVENTAKLFGLNNESVSNERAEVLGQGSKREGFDIVTARAVGRLNLISELCLPLVKVGGAFLAMKSLSTDEELDEAKKAIDLLGGKVENVFTYTLTDGNEEIERSIVVIRKIKNTPQKYPRNNSQISKRPL